MRELSKHLDNRNYLQACHNKTGSEHLLTVKNNWHKDWGVYPNVGKSMPEKDGFIKHKHKNIKILNFLKMIVKDGAKVIGACCGSTPDTISNIVKTLESN